VVSGAETVFERMGVLGQPQLVEIRFPLPGVAMRVEGWALGIEEVLDLAGRLGGARAQDGSHEGSQIPAPMDRSSPKIRAAQTAPQSELPAG